VRGKHDDAAALIRMWDPDAPPPSAEALKKAKMNGGVVQKTKVNIKDLMYRVELPGAQAGVELCEAASIGDTEAVERLMENGVEPMEADYDDRTALHLASCEGHLSVVQLLLQHKADVTAKDRFGWNALDDAVRHGHKEVQAALREAGANLSVGDMGVRMCQAAADDDGETLEVLLVNGVHSSTADYDSRTALHLAAANGNISIIDKLLRLEGIEVNSVDRVGGTPLEEASRHEQVVAVQMLTQAGGLRKGDAELDKVVQQQTIAQEKQNKQGREDMVKEKIESSQERREMLSIQATLDNLWKTLGALRTAVIDVQDILVMPEGGWRFVDGTEDDRKRSAAINHDFLNEVEVSVKALNEQVMVAHKLMNGQTGSTRLSQVCRQRFNEKKVEVEAELLTAFKLCRLLGKLCREGRRMLDTRKISWIHSERAKKRTYRWKNVRNMAKYGKIFSKKEGKQPVENMDPESEEAEEIRHQEDRKKRREKQRLEREAREANQQLIAAQQSGGLVRTLTDKNLAASGLATGQKLKKNPSLKFTESKRRLEKNKAVKPTFLATD